MSSCNSCSIRGRVLFTLFLSFSSIRRLLPLAFINLKNVTSSIHVPMLDDIIQGDTDQPLVTEKPDNNRNFANLKSVQKNVWNLETCNRKMTILLKHNEAFQLS